MLVNTLIHREFTSAHYAKFIIEKDKMFTENANRAVTGSVITPDNLEPNPKNPIIAAFFRNIGLADELGSGTRKLYYYVPRYSGKPPEMIDGDVFRVIVPLDDEYSFEVDKNKNFGVNFGANFGVNATQQKIIELMIANPHIKAQEIADKTGITKRSVEYAIRALKKANIIEHTGAAKNGKWVIVK